MAAAKTVVQEPTPPSETPPSCLRRCGCTAVKAAEVGLLCAATACGVGVLLSWYQGNCNSLSGTIVVLLLACPVMGLSRVGVRLTNMHCCLCQSNRKRGKKRHSNMCCANNSVEAAEMYAQRFPAGRPCTSLLLGQHPVALCVLIIIAWQLVRFVECPSPAFLAPVWLLWLCLACLEGFTIVMDFAVLKTLWQVHNAPVGVVESPQATVIRPKLVRHETEEYSPVHYQVALGEHGSGVIPPNNPTLRTLDLSVLATNWVNDGPMDSPQQPGVVQSPESTNAAASVQPGTGLSSPASTTSARQQLAPIPLPSPDMVPARPPSFDGMLPLKPTLSLSARLPLPAVQSGDNSVIVPVRSMTPKF